MIRRALDEEQRLSAIECLTATDVVLEQILEG